MNKISLRKYNHLESLLLSLLPPSCMVVLIRELANKLSSTSAINLQPLQMAQFPSNMDMDIDTDIIRGRSTSSSKTSSRELHLLLHTMKEWRSRTIFWMKTFKSQSIALSYPIYQITNKQISWSAKQLTIAPRREHNVFEMRHWPSTTLLNHKVRVWLTAMLTHVLHRRLSIFSYYMILIRQLSKIYGMVVFTPFHYIVHLNIFYQILKISKSLFVASLTTLKTRVLITPKQMIYWISIV